jgi:hypothetical protein
MDPFTGLPYGCGVATTVPGGGGGGGSTPGKCEPVSSVWQSMPPSPLRKSCWKKDDDTSTVASDLSSLMSSLYSYETWETVESTKSQESSGAQSECSQTSSSSGSSNHSSGLNSICSLTSSSAPSSTHQSDLGCDATPPKNDDPLNDIPHDTMVQWLHKISHEGVHMFAQTFQNSITRPSEAVSIAAALLRYQQQAVIEVPETMYEMLDATMRVYTLSENEKDALAAQLKVSGEHHKTSIIELENICEASRFRATDIQVEAEATVVISDVGVRVMQWKVHCNPGPEVPVPAWILDVTVPMPIEYARSWDAYMGTSSATNIIA